MSGDDVPIETMVFQRGGNRDRKRVHQHPGSKTNRVMARKKKQEASSSSSSSSSATAPKVAPTNLEATIRLTRVATSSSSTSTANMLERYLEFILGSVREETGVALYCRGSSEHGRRSLTAQLGARGGAGAESAKEAAKRTVDFSNEEVEVTVALGEKERRAEEREAAKDQLERHLAEEEARTEEETREIREKIVALEDDALLTVEENKREKSTGWKGIREAEENKREIRRLGEELFLREQSLREFRIVCRRTAAKLDALDADGDLDGDGGSPFSDALAEIQLTFGCEIACCRQLLPVYSYRSRIVQSVADNRVTVLVAETGSGKSSQVPKYLYLDYYPEEGGCRGGGAVTCTQPRKVAATNLAEYVGVGLGERKGKRGRRKVAARTSAAERTRVEADLVFTTDNALLQEWAADPMLSAYRCVVVDEAHERTLATDLLLSILKKTLKQRPDFRVVITSATIDPAVFSEYFRDFSTNVINVPGKLHPVRTVWSHRELNLGKNYVEEAVEKILEIFHDGDNDDGGDVLVFVATLADTERGSKLLEARCPPAIFQRLHVLSLHGRLRQHEQREVFGASPGRRKVIFSTNVAETSVTVPGVTSVVDCGMAKERQFDPRTGASVLRLTAVSKSSARQRAGRAGRTAPGRCYRLYTEGDFEGMREAVDPEIKRLPLDQCLLLLFKLGVTNPGEYEFLDPPSPQAVLQSLDSLRYLEAIEPRESNDCANEGFSLTTLGRKMSHFPIDPRLSRMLVLCLQHHPEAAPDVAELCALVANGGNIFFRQGTDQEKEAADARRIRFCDERGDFLTMLNVYKEWRAVGDGRGGGDRARNRWCGENYINAKSLKAAESTVREIRAIARTFLNHQVPPAARPQQGESYSDLLLEFIAHSYYRNVAMFTGHPDQGYVTRDGDRLLVVHPGSSISYLSSGYPEFVVFESIFTTTKPFLMHVTTVQEDLRDIFGDPGVRRKLVTKLEVGPIGGMILKSRLIGKGFGLLKELEKQLRRMVNPGGEPRTDREVTDFVRLEADVKKGLLTAHCHQDHAPAVREALEEKVASIRSELREETLEAASSTAGTGQTVVVGVGCTVLAPLMPDDFVEICVKQPYDGDLLDAFVRENMSSRKTMVFLKDGRCIVAFRLPADASTAFDTLEKSLEGLGLERKQVMMKRRRQEGGRSSRQPSLCVTLQLRRRERTNFGFLRFENPTSAGIYLSSRSHASWKARRSKKGQSEVFLTGMDATVTEDDVRSTVDRCLGPVEVCLPAQKSFASTKAEIQALEVDLARRLPGILGTDRFQLRLPPNCQPGHVFWKVFLEFSDIEVGILAARRLRATQPSFSDGTKNYPFSSSDYRINTTMVVFTDVYEMLKDDIMEISPDLKVVKHPSCGRVTLQMEGSDYDQISRTRSALVDLLEERLLEGADVRFLLAGSRVNRTRLQEVERARGVIVRRSFVGFGASAVAVFGRRAGAEAAIRDLQDILRDIMDANSGSCAIKLCGEGRRGLLKRTVQEFGADLGELTRRKGVLEARLMLRGRKRELHLRGTVNELEKIKARVAEMLVEVKEGSGVDEEDQEEECCVTCFTEPEEGDETRLELCGHLTCKSCLRLQVQTAELPMVCPKESCGQEVCVHDLKQCLSDESGPDLRDGFLSAALEAFVASHGDTHAFCPTPDCGAVFRKGKEDDGGGGYYKKPFFCPGCKTDICTTCCVPFHSGMSCETYKLMNGENKELKTWFAADPLMRKWCPKCGSGIEKVDGCDKMQCARCGAILCWRCLRTFARAGEVYAHLDGCAAERGFGGVGVGADLDVGRIGGGRAGAVGGIGGGGRVGAVGGIGGGARVGAVGGFGGGGRVGAVGDFGGGGRGGRVRGVGLGGDLGAGGFGGVAIGGDRVGPAGGRIGGGRGDMGRADHGGIRRVLHAVADFLFGRR